ncbi:MAG: LacI family transcriptional regulator [Desulfobacterales bacterium]|nr:LacI family transcriptional regulator [Desulfobacterales bacterium]
MNDTQKKLTMQQLADELGLSRVTVSSVINGKGLQRNISQKTINRVKAYVKTRGFVPSQHARDLRLGSRAPVGIIHSGQLYSHLIEAFNLFNNYFSSQNLITEIVVVNRGNLVNGFKNLISRGINKLIWINTRDPGLELDSAEEILYLLKNVHSVIYQYIFDNGLWDRRLTESGIYLVGPNERKIHAELALFIKSLGHRNIIVCEYFESLECAGYGFAEAFKKVGLNVLTLEQPTKDANRISSIGKFFAEKIVDAMRSDEITAACFYDDEIASECMHELLSMGVKIPEELSMTGYDNLKFTKYLSVPLTTVQMPVQEMVSKTVALIESKQDKQKHLFDLEIIKRKSHGFKI